MNLIKNEFKNNYFIQLKMGIWNCNICDYICPPHRCHTSSCYNNLCDSCFRIYKNNLKNYIINNNLEDIIEDKPDNYLCKECIRIKIEKRKELEFE